MAVSSLYVTQQPGVGFSDVCTLEISAQYEAVPSIVCSLCLSFGLIYCFFGYRCFRMVMFFSGFMFGSGAVLLIFHMEPTLDERLRPEAKAGMGLGVGVLCGLLAMLVSTLGLLLSGLQLGSLVALSLLMVLGQFYSLNPLWAPLSAVLAAGVTAAVFTLQWQKLFCTVYTSVFGATVVMLCADYLLGGFLLPQELQDLMRQVSPRPFCWFNWALTGICPALSTAGVLVQWCITAKGASHTKAAHKKQKKHSMKAKGQEARRRPKHQRRPPPLKRYAGDVLAPSYLRRLQEQQHGTGSSTSSVSTITHTLIDFDFETGSMVPLTTASPTFSV